MIALTATPVIQTERLILRAPQPVSYIDPDNTRSRALAERMGAVCDPDAALPHFTHGQSAPLVYRHPKEAA